MKKLCFFICICALSILGSANMYAQKCKCSKDNRGSDLIVYDNNKPVGRVVGFSAYQCNFLVNGNLLPLNPKYQKELVGKILPTYSFTLVASLKPSRYKSGITFDYSTLYTSLGQDAQKSAQLSLWAIGWTGISMYSYKALNIVTQSTLSYANYNCKLIPWDVYRPRYIKAHGIQLKNLITVGYQITDDFGINLQTGFSILGLFKWHGDTNIISPSSYTGGILGKNSNISILPFIGIAFSVR